MTNRRPWTTARRCVKGTRTGESGDDRQAQIQAAEDELLSLAAQFGNREITRPQWEAARAPVAARLEALRNPWPDPA